MSNLRPKLTIRERELAETSKATNDRAQAIEPSSEAEFVLDENTKVIHSIDVNHRVQKMPLCPDRL